MSFLPFICSRKIPRASGYNQVNVTWLWLLARAAGIIGYFGSRSDFYKRHPVQDAKLKTLKPRPYSAAHFPTPHPAGKEPNTAQHLHVNFICKRILGNYNNSLIDIAGARIFSQKNKDCGRSAWMSHTCRIFVLNFEVCKLSNQSPLLCVNLIRATPKKSLSTR